MIAPASHTSPQVAVVPDDGGRELLRAYAESRSEGAFAEFVHRHITLVHSAALRRTGGDAHAAADVTQQVFVAAARHAHALGRHPRLTAWLHAATRNAALNLMRAEYRRKQRERVAQAGNELLAMPASEDEWTQLRPVLDQAMDELNEQDREAVLQRFFEGRPLAEIGARMRVSENAARMRVERALDKLRCRLARRGLTSTSAALGAFLASEASAAIPVELAASVTGGALASSSAASTGVTALGLWNLMSTAKIITGASAILGLAGIGSAVFEARETRRASERMSVAIYERDESRAQLAALERRARAAEQNAVIAATRVATLEQELQSARQQARDGARTVVAAVAAKEATLPSRTGDAELEEEKRRLRHRYDPFLLQQRGLTAAQADRFVELKIEQARIREDLQASVRQAGITGGTRTVEDLRAKLYAPVTKEMRELLGEDGYRAYHDYEMTSGAHLNYIEPMRPAFTSANVPLSATQEQQLVRIIIANNHPERVNPTDLGTRSRIDWDAVVAQANTLLTSEQLMVFREVANRKKSGK